MEAKRQDMTTGEESSADGGSQQQPPVKKKTSVKVVKRVSKKKPEAGAGASRPDTPQEAISEAEPAPAPTPTPTPAAAPPPAAAPAPVPETTTRRVSSKRRVGQRAGSNVFAMFTQNQVAQFKEAFGFIDQDKDGIISKGDIRATFDALGRLCSDRELDEMTGEAPGPINFTMFLSVFGDRVQGTDDEDVVQQAFGRFDEGDGFCKEDK